MIKRKSATETLCDDAQVVRSEAANPSRPQGDGGVRQPIQPEVPRERVVPLPPDDAVAEAVRAALSEDGRLQDATISVAVRDAAVDLSGDVSSEFQRGLAEALAAAVPGALAVYNRITVQDQAGRD